MGTAVVATDFLYFDTKSKAAIMAAKAPAPTVKPMAVLVPSELTLWDAMLLSDESSLVELVFVLSSLLSEESSLVELEFVAASTSVVVSFPSTGR